MQTPSIRQAAEIFHLLFLKHFGTRVDKNLYSLKGGCNLRFYFQSVRYSEDIDLDVHTVAKNTLKSNVDKTLESPALIQSLRTYGIEITSFTAPKQTETTQRWKPQLRLSSSGIPIATKIEFSRPNPLLEGEIATFEKVDPQILNAYKMQPIGINHYPRDAAFLQKINALIHRTETQARDVFDLSLLMDKGATATTLSPMKPDEREKARENALSVGFEEFKGQVYAYLDPEFQALHETKDSWDLMIERVVDELGKLPRP
jgi:predicted nucleotidyltransferase component of viral defense system